MNMEIKYFKGWSLSSRMNCGDGVCSQGQAVSGGALDGELAEE
jgi:hypothetical protein